MSSSTEKPSFSIADYVVLALMLAVSSAIGIYHAYASRKRRSSKEFLLASRTMTAVPVAMSLVASFISAITVIGTTAEVYLLGTMVSVYAINYAVSLLLTAHWYMPIFYRLKLTSANEYLEIRFKSKAVRVLGCLTFIFQTVLYMGVAIYAPSLALNAVTGFSLWGSVLTVGLVCTFYTTIGGMKAVLWTDVFQLCVIVVGFLMVIIRGSIDNGGWGNVMKICREGGRIEFDNFDVDPTYRLSYWTMCVGGLFTFLGIYGVNQGQVQRYMSCRSEREAKIAIYLNIPGLVLIMALATCSGLAMYAKYHDCDPYFAGYIQATDQLMPYFVMDILRFLPGLPGLFVSCMFSGALSTVSSGLNALAAATGEDCIRQIWKNMPEEKYARITKGLALFYGLFCVFMAWVSSQLGGVLQVSLSIFGMVGGPLLGLFSLGMFFPWANSKGAILGLLSGLFMAFWFGIGSIVYPWPAIRELKPLSIAGCPVPNITSDLTTLAYTTPSTMGITPGSTTPTLTAPDNYPSFAQMFQISYLYYGTIAWVTAILVGLLVSFVTGPMKPEDVDPRTICSIVDKCCCCLSSKRRKAGYCGVRFGEEDEEEKKLSHCQMTTVAVQADMTEVDGQKSADAFATEYVNNNIIKHED
ncbi:sodium-coupled monocarboxylate transporter 1-like [Glandiceps talaboti]